MDQYSDIKNGCEVARLAARSAVGQTAGERNGAIRSIADRILSEGDAILEANQRDAELAEGQLPVHMIRRLRLDEAGLGLLCHRLLAVAAAPDPLREDANDVRSSGFEIAVRRAPLGAVAFAYDCRPEMTALAAAACIKTANAAILAPGFATSGTDSAVLKAIRGALRESAYPFEAVKYIDPIYRSAPDALCKMRGTVDLLVLKDGELSQDVTVDVPVITGSRGICHVYIDKGCDVPFAVRTTVRSLYSDSASGASGHATVVLVHSEVAADFLQSLKLAIQRYSPEMRGCPVAREYLEDAIPAARGDWSEVHAPDSNVLAVRVVESMEQAVSHINTYGTSGVDAVMTSDAGRARLFERMTDSRVVMVNAPLSCDVLSDGVSAALGIDGLSVLTRKKYLISGAVEKSAI